MKDSKWLIGYGVFLFLCGLAGYLSNPVAAKTALMSGSLFGFISLVWGFLLGKGFGFARWAAILTCAFLSIIFGWRASVSWAAVADGAPKAFAATLITLMLIASAATVVRLLRRGGRDLVGSSREPA